MGSTTRTRATQTERVTSSTSEEMKVQAKLLQSIFANTKNQLSAMSEKMDSLEVVIDDTVDHDGS